MRFELPATRMHRKILTAPALLEIDADVMKLSVITKSLLVFVLALLYSMFMFGSIHTIITKTMHDKKVFIFCFITLAIFFSIVLFVLIKLIFKDKRDPLVFTENGITGAGFINTTYDQIDTYTWQNCRGILATGQRSKQAKKTLMLTGKDNFLRTAVYRDRFGNSIFSNNGYFFDNNQIKCVEEIFSRFGINKIPGVAEPRQMSVENRTTMEPISEESLRKGYRLAAIYCYFCIASAFLFTGSAAYLAKKNAPFHGYHPLPIAAYNKLRLIFLALALADLALISYIRKSALSSSNQAGRNKPVLKLLVITIISFALCFTIVIYGFILFMLNGGRQDLYLFIIIALAAFAFHFPRFNRWQELVQGMQSQE